MSQPQKVGPLLDLVHDYIKTLEEPKKLSIAQYAIALRDYGLSFEIGGVVVLKLYCDKDRETGERAPKSTPLA